MQTQNSALRRAVRMCAAPLFVFAVAACDSAADREELAKEANALRGDVEKMVEGMESGTPTAGATNIPMPKGEEARAMWVLRQVMAEIPAYVDSLSGSHGVNINVLPAAWQTPEYLAGASSHPEVRDYFVRYKAYLDGAVVGMPQHVRDRLRVLVRQAGLNSALERRALEGFNKTFPESADLLNHTGRAVVAAIAYHDFLAQVDPRVSVDGGQAMFANDSELSRAQELEGAMMTLFQEVNEKQQAAARRAQARMDSLQSLLN
jgi:hypothetical protein